MPQTKKEVKVIFLDVDGVLNCKTTEDRLWREKGKDGIKGIDDEKVEILARIIKETGAVIVVSSTWRLNKVKNVFDEFYLFYEDLSEEEYAENYRKKRTPYRYLKEKLKKCKLKIYDDTPDSGKMYGRGQEISEWLELHPEVKQFVILDDEEFRDFETYGLDDRVVYTSYSKGLTEEKAEEVIALLR